MDTPLAVPAPHDARIPRAARRFALAALALAAAAALVAGWAPLGFSIVTVFLFAGPHNWVQFRFLLARMPARWGPLRGFFLLGIGGAVGLAGAFILLSVIGRAWESGAWTLASAA